MVKNSKKLRRKILLPIIAGIITVPCALGLVACAHAITEQDLIDRGFTNLVVYDYQGGKVSDAETTTIRVVDESYLPQPGADKSGLSAPSRSGYSFRDFCVATTDENGNIVPDETRVWDFATDKCTEENLTLCARWWKNYSIVLYYGDNYSEKKTIDVGRNTLGSPIAVSTTEFAVKDYTFFEYYTDKNEQNRFILSDGISQETYESAENGVVEIYGKSLAGTYSIINTALELANATIGDYTNIYINADLNMTDVYNANRTFAFPSAYGGTILGNGHKIYDLKLTQTPSNVSDKYFGIFKAVNSTAVISDLTFVNVTLDVSLSNPRVPDYEVGMLAGIVRDGAKLTNVNIIGGELKVTATSDYDLSKITVSEFISINNATDIEGCSSKDIAITKIATVYDGDYTAYLTYDESDDEITFTSLVKLTVLSGRTETVIEGTATKNADSDNQFIFTATNGDVYTVTVDDSDNYVYTAVILKNNG